MSYSQRLGGPVCILNQHKILELNKTQGPLTFQRLSTAGYIEIRIAVSAALNTLFWGMTLFCLFSHVQFYIKVQCLAMISKAWVQAYDSLTLLLTKLNVMVFNIIMNLIIFHHDHLIFTYYNCADIQNLKLHSSIKTKNCFLFFLPSDL